MTTNTGIGRQVMCIENPDTWDFFCCNLGFPAFGMIYTIVATGEIDGEPGLFLAELPPIRYACCLNPRRGQPSVLLHSIRISSLRPLVDQTPEMLPMFN